MAKILIIDDSTFEANHVKGILESAGHEVFWAETGSRGIKMVRLTWPDLILLDLILPDIAGIEICRWIRHDSKIKNTPIVILTAKGDSAEKVAGLQEGASDYIVKPFDDSELKARVTAVLREQELRKRLEKKNAEYEELLKKLEKMSITDPLTGLYNRRHFEDLLVLEFERFKRFSTPFACLILDIDHFKEVNDTCGHVAGDALLKSVGQFIQARIRGIDVVARYGGDEFVTLLSQLPLDGAENLASRLISTCSEHPFHEVDPRITRITLSIGVATLPDPGLETIDQIVKCADYALYMAKTAGRNCYRITTAEALS